MPAQRNDLLQGTLDLLVLHALAGEARHGYGVMRWIREVSDDGFEIKEGALYPALHRLEARGWLESEWGVSKGNRQARFYRLTAAGRHQLEVETASWRRYVGAVAKVVEAGLGKAGA